MRYEIIIPNPFNPEERIMLSLPLDIVGIHRTNGEKFINVNGYGGMFDEKGNPYVPSNMEPGH